MVTGIVVDTYGYAYALYLGAGISILGAIILLTSQVRPIVPISQRSPVNKTATRWDNPTKAIYITLVGFCLVLVFFKTYIL